jgi:hypothetical protein
MADMKRVSITGKRGPQILHVETDLGIVNIYVGLMDDFGRRVESVELIADDYAGEPKVSVDGYVRSRFVQERWKE